jgi:DNA helicase-2/ATP-dependent DNA helicase PcrA
VRAKQRRHLLDYDDLLLYWFHLMQDPASAAGVRRRFDHVLVDEYQDTNALQAGILLGLKPDGRGLTVVGDDAQAIYAFRAATVRNIRDFPHQFDPPAHVVTLEQNYRSTQPILDAANAVMALAAEGFAKRLFSTRPRAVSSSSRCATTGRGRLRRGAGARAPRGGHRAQAAGGADAHRAPFRRARGRAGPPQHPVREVRRAQVPRGRPREGRAVRAALGREPARRDGGVPGAAALPGLGPSVGAACVDALEQAAFDLAVLPGLEVPAAARAEWPSFGELLVSLHRAPEWLGQLGLVCLGSTWC